VLSGLRVCAVRDSEDSESDEGASRGGGAVGASVTVAVG
jgi:hypothetical protein